MLSSQFAAVHPSFSRPSAGTSVSVVEVRTPIQTHPRPATQNVGVAATLKKERLCGDAHQHQAFAARLTPGGGLHESGTKKSGDSGWLGSTRHAAQYVLHSPARTLSSSRNW